MPADLPARDDEDRPRRSVAHEIGQRLDDLSVEDLTERVEFLRREIERLEATRAAKQAARTAAGSVFKL